MKGPELLGGVVGDAFAPARGRAIGLPLLDRVPKYVPDSTELHRPGLISLDATGTNRPQMAC